MSKSIRIAHLFGPSVDSSIIKLFKELGEGLKDDGIEFEIIESEQNALHLEKVQIIHVHEASLSFLKQIMLKVKGKKFFYGQHNSISTKNISRMYSCIICSTNEIKEKILAKSRFLKDKCRVIFDGINLERFQPTNDNDLNQSIRNRNGIREDSFLIGSIGSLIEENDYLTLLKAFNKLHQKRVNAELVIAGDGPLKAQLEKFAHDYQFHDRLKIITDESNTNNVLKIIDVFVLSSYKPGFSPILIQAMAMGKAVIATNIAGHREIIKEAKTGFLVPCGFPERIESAIMRYYVNSSLIEKMGSAATQDVQKFFSLKRMEQSYKEVYRNLLR